MGGGYKGVHLLFFFFPVLDGYETEENEIIIEFISYCTRFYRVYTLKKKFFLSII